MTVVNEVKQNESPVIQRYSCVDKIGPQWRHKVDGDTWPRLSINTGKRKYDYDLRTFEREGGICVWVAGQHVLPPSIKGSMICLIIIPLWKIRYGCILVIDGPTVVESF